MFCKNLPAEWDEAKLTEIFAEYGNVLSVSLSVDESGKSKQFGFASYEMHEDAERAVNELNGKEYNGKNIYVGRAQKKAERQTELKVSPRAYELYNEEFNHSDFGWGPYRGSPL